jgi:hypothetical protein
MRWCSRPRRCHRLLLYDPEEMFVRGEVYAIGVHWLLRDRSGLKPQGVTPCGYSSIFNWLLRITNSRSISLM